MKKSTRGEAIAGRAAAGAGKLPAIDKAAAQNI
jgi:hypothetical protein